MPTPVCRAYLTNEIMKFKFLTNLRKQYLIWLTFVSTTIVNLAIVYSFILKSDSSSYSSEIQSEQLEIPQAVSALGILEPQGEVIQIAPPVFTEGTRVEQLLVKLGDQVKAGQVIAILDTHSRMAAALKKAEAQVLIAQAKLRQVKAGAKQGEINAQKARINNLEAELEGQVIAQKATIERLKAELKGEKEAQQAIIERLKAEWDNAKVECDRYKRLYQDGAVNASNRDQKCLAEKTARKRIVEAEVNLTEIVRSRGEEIKEAQANLQRITMTLAQQQAEAKATLEQIKEVRAVDVSIEEAELQSAQASVEQAKVDFDSAHIRAPKAGQILKINTLPGERVNNEGLMELGQTGQMYVNAEVYETDINRVQVGQRATITSQGFPGILQGTVDEIGLAIGKKDILGNDPVADIDSRVFEVKIRLDASDSQKVANLTNLQVRVIIDSSTQN